MKEFTDLAWNETAQEAENIRNTDAFKRIDLLKDLQKQIREHTEEIFLALEKDLKKPRTESLLTEIAPVMQEISFITKNLAAWMRPQKVKSPLSLFGSQNWTKYEAKGRVLILSPWNYPYRLAMNPLIAAIAAGNFVFLKTSEHSPHTGEIIEKIIKRSQLSSFIRCFSGGPETAQKLLQKPFDHIFFTGGTEIGRKVMMEAAKHLSPVTLELGGKSPTFVLEDADLDISVERILWGKFMNAGQTCVAPDYLLIHESKVEDFKVLCKKILDRFYDNDAKESGSYARIINEQHCKNLIEQLEEVKGKADFIYGGNYSLAEKYIEPTIILNPPANAKLLHEEVFGPLLPVISFSNLADAISLVKAKPKPLALYVFTSSKEMFSSVCSQISSGAACLNTVATHLANPHLPFGGIGSSGLGRYHGKFGFMELSHLRAYQKIPKRSVLRTLFPPYGKIEKKLEDWKEMIYKL